MPGCPAKGRPKGMAGGQARMAIGETGSLSENTTYAGEPISVTFTEPLDDPVIALTSTNHGGNKFSLRVIDIQTDGSGAATGFRFTIDEWENHDGAHPAVETINWLALESGTHVLPDGRLVEAGHAEADSDGEDVTLRHDFREPPVILTTVASDRGPSHVDSDPTNVTGTGFTLSVEEAEREDGIHGYEKVGWIAIEAGGDGRSGTASNASTVDSDWNRFDLGASFDRPIVLAETQTKIDPDTGNVIYRNLGPGRIDLRFEEDTSVDADAGHAPETVGIVAFEAGVILCFTAGTRIGTDRGQRPVEDLRPGDRVVTRDSGVRRLLWTCRTRIDADTCQPHLRPVRIPRDAFGPGLPARDTDVSPQHRLLLTDWRATLLFGTREVLAPAKALFAPARCGETEYVHLLFDRHEIVTANGLPMESFHPGRMCKTALPDPARAELFALFPELRTAPEAWGPSARAALSPREAALLAPRGRAARSLPSTGAIP